MSNRTLPKPLPELTPQQIERFWSYINKTTNCWLWTGTTTGRYTRAAFCVANNMYYAARLMYFLHTGDDPQVKRVCHTCDNVICVNPAHLWLGSPTENNHDRDAKGRHVPLQGESNGEAKLTEDNIRIIRESTQPQRTLAKLYSVSQSTIWRARNTHWKHVR